MSAESQRVHSTDEEPGRSGTLGLPSTSPLSVLWYSLMMKPWTTLGLVSPDDPGSAWALAQSLVKIASLPPEELKAVSVLQATPSRAQAIARSVAPRKVKASGQAVRFVLATDSPLDNPVALGVLASCDAVVLVLGQGRSRIPDARRTLDLIGHERILGAVFAEH